MEMVGWCSGGEVGEVAQLGGVRRGRGCGKRSKWAGHRGMRDGIGAGGGVVQAVVHIVAQGWLLG